MCILPLGGSTVSLVSSERKIFFTSSSNDHFEVRSKHYLHKYLLRQRKWSIRTPRDQDHHHVEKISRHSVKSNRISIVSFKEYMEYIYRYYIPLVWWNYSKENLSIVWMTRYSKSKNVFTATLKVLASSHLKSTIKSCPSTFKTLLEPPRFGSGSTRKEFQATVACSSDSKGTLRLEKIVTKHYYFLSN